MSPELLAKKSYYGHPAGIWALGVILFLLLSHQFPFKGNMEQVLLKNILAGNMLPSVYSVRQQVQDLLHLYLRIISC
jgi:serine/threonine protein kinase